jgi:Trk K+ transport system NAD-binding subunit
VKLANLKGDREILKGSIRKNSGFEGKEVSELKEMSNFPSSFRVAALVREEEEFVDPSDQSLNRDDELVLIGPEEGKKSLNRFFQNQ